LVWVNRDGKEEPLAAPPDQYGTVSISPDGKRVALTITSTPKNHIYIWDVVRGTRTRLIPDEGAHDLAPIWTPDGKRIVYTSSREDILMGDIYWRASDGTGAAEKLASLSGRGLFPSSWSKDGKTLLLIELSYPYLQTDVGMLSMEGNHTLKPLLQENVSESLPVISPDGRWMAYVSGAVGSSKTEVYVCPFPDVNKSRWQISTSGGSNPLWSPNGRELFYRSGDAVMAVRVETDSEFKPEKPIVLFRGAHYSKSEGMYNWDVSPDGKRFLMIENVVATANPAAPESPRKINIVLNWFEELKQRVPVHVQ
jgi:eukaryotic-like serine/threonine-protein kinase